MLEKLGQMTGLNSDSSVFHGDLESILFRFILYQDFDAAIFSELNGIGKIVSKNLLDSILVDVTVLGHGVVEQLRELDSLILCH